MNLKRRIICYFETEAQCEAAVTALQSANINTDDIRIVSDSTKKSTHTKDAAVAPIGSSAPIAQPADLIYADGSPQTNLAQAPIATLLIRGDLFTYRDMDETPLGSYAVEVCGDKNTLDLARDILLNLF